MLINRFLMDVVPNVLSRPNGVAYLVALEKNNISDLLDLLKDEHRIKGTVAIQRKAGVESLFVIKYSWMAEV